MSRNRITKNRSHDFHQRADSFRQSRKPCEFLVEQILKEVVESSTAESLRSGKVNHHGR
jgi:hypothetical protein